MGEHNAFIAAAFSTEEAARLQEAARIIDRLNIFAGQRKNWLPPSYGKKHYADMTQEEKIVIDEFQGEKAYESVMRDPTMLISTSDIALAALPQAL